MQNRGRSGPFRHVNEVSVYLGRWREGGREGFPIERMSLRSFLIVTVSGARVSNFHEGKNILFLVQNEECVREHRFFFVFFL